MPNTTTTNYINSINQAFPVAGVDNNSQGFRDNFANIAQALGSINNDVDNLQVNSVRLDRSNNFSGNLIQQAQFQNCSETVFDGTGVVEGGDITVDYSRGNFQKFILGGGTHNIGVTNWPDSKSAGLVVSVITATTFNTFVNFSGANLTNLSYDSFPFKLGSGPYLFQIIYDGTSGETFVKKLNERTLNATTIDVNSEYVTGTYVTALSELTIGPNKYTVDDNFNTKISADDSGTVREGRIALLPNQITTTIGPNNIPLNGTTSTTTFNVSTSSGIGIGADFVFTGTTTIFTVVDIDNTRITTQEFVMSRNVLSDGDSITFRNPRFADQPVLLNLTDVAPSSTTSEVGDLKGQVFASSTSVYVTYADYAPNTTNKVKLLTPSDVSSYLPIGSIILWYGSVGTIPTGWALCNGANGTPDLRNRFIVGAGGTYSVGAIGGSADAIVPYHNHSITDEQHSHNYATLSYNQGGANVNANPGVTINPITSQTDPAFTGITETNYAGESVTNKNLPPYHALCYIMKVA